MNTNRNTPRRIELNRDGEVITVASFRIPRETWQAYRDLIDSEHRTPSADLRRYVEGRLAEAGEVAA